MIIVITIVMIIVVIAAIVAPGDGLPYGRRRPANPWVY